MKTLAKELLLLLLVPVVPEHAVVTSIHQEAKVRVFCCRSQKRDIFLSEKCSQTCPAFGDQICRFLDWPVARVLPYQVQVTTAAYALRPTSQHGLSYSTTYHGL